MTPTEERADRRLGIWLIGARGAISTCVCYGLAGLRHGLLEPVGMVTEGGAPFDGLPLCDLGAIALGGHEVTRRSLSDSAAELVRAGVLSADLVAASTGDAAAFDARVRPGVLDGPDVGIADLLPEASRMGSAPPREQIERLSSDLEEFRRDLELDRVVVVELASTEALRQPAPDGTRPTPLRSRAP